jgi:hypothetical protein
MENTVSLVLNAIPDLSIRKALDTVIDALADRSSSRMLRDPVLTFTAAALVSRTSVVSHLVVDGRLATIGQPINMPTLSGTVTNARFNVFVYFQDAAGVRTAVMGTEGTSLGGIIFPPMPQKKAVIGMLIVNPTGTGPFVGGTTALDDATVVPNAVHLSGVAGFDPTILLG